MLAPYGARLSGFQGYHKFPHTVMAVAVKAPAPADFAARAGRFSTAYDTYLARAKDARPTKTKLREALGRVYRSKGERYQVDHYYTADLTLDVGTAAIAQAG
jgi:hypothetical protein